MDLLYPVGGGSIRSQRPWQRNPARARVDGEGGLVSIVPNQTVGQTLCAEVALQSKPDENQHTRELTSTGAMKHKYSNKDLRRLW